MLVENASSKVIGIGKLNLMPYEKKTLPQEFVGNAVLKSLEKMGRIKFIEEQEAKEAIANLSKLKKGELEELAINKGIELVPDETLYSLREKLKAFYEV